MRTNSKGSIAVEGAEPAAGTNPHFAVDAAVQHSAAISPQRFILQMVDALGVAHYPSFEFT